MKELLYCPLGANLPMPKTFPFCALLQTWSRADVAAEPRSGSNANKLLGALLSNAISGQLSFSFWCTTTLWCAPTLAR
jgi:hypothetical protein